MPNANVKKNEQDFSDGSLESMDKESQTPDFQERTPLKSVPNRELEGVTPPVSPVFNDPYRGGSQPSIPEGRPVEREKGPVRSGARGTAAMDPETRQEVARKGGLAVSRNRQHMAEIGKKGGQTVSKNKEHMAEIGRKGGEASRRHR